MQRLLNEGEARGWARGWAKGWARGKTRGEARGEVQGKISSVRSILLKRFNQVDSSIFKSLEQYNDPVVLESLVVQAALCDSLNEFERYLTPCG
ncbi:MAG: hypothetical protein LBQ66_13605 [Planctomycetaceae bacterium]|nr:hypothetical protein [Planctomycetaceae bacterium]